MKRRGPGVVAFVALAFSSGPAGADDAREAARGHAEAAERAVAAGDFATALREYEAARDLFPSPLIQLNIAQALGELDRPASAIEALQVLLRAEGVPEERRAQALAEVARLRARAARLVVSVDRAGATVRIGTRTVCRSPCADPILVDPGRVAVEVTRDGFEPARQVVELEPARESSLSFELRPDRPPEPRAERPAVAVVAVVGPPEHPAAPRRDRTVAWLAGGGAVALSIAGAVLGSFALVRHGELEDQDQSRPDGWERARDLAGDVRTLRTATDVVLGAALVSAAVCVISLLTGGPTPADQRPSAGPRS